MVASRWPLRFSPAAEISRLTSASVRYSRERTSALRRRFGGPALSTVPLTVVGATSARCDFSMVFRPFLCNCPYNGPLRDTMQGKKRRFNRHNCSFRRGGRASQHARDAELASIFYGAGTTDATARNDLQ